MAYKWSFTDRSIGGCLIVEVSTVGQIVAIVPRPTRDEGGQKKARERAQEIVLAHNEVN